MKLIVTHLTIVKSIGLEIFFSIAYRYIEKHIVSVSNMDLPYTVSYKKRKKINKKYEYPDNNHVSRKNRTYIQKMSSIWKDLSQWIF